MHTAALLRDAMALTTVIFSYFKSCIHLQFHKHLHTFPRSETKPFHCCPLRNGLKPSWERRAEQGGRNTNSHHNQRSAERSAHPCVLTEGRAVQQLLTHRTTHRKATLKSVLQAVTAQSCGSQEVSVSTGSLWGPCYSSENCRISFCSQCNPGQSVTLHRHEGCSANVCF